MKNSIEKIVEQYSDKDWINIIDGLDREARRLKNLRKRNEQQQEYLRAAREVVFFLGNGIKSASLDEDEFMAMKPLIQKLVDKGNLKKEIMAYFD